VRGKRGNRGEAEDVGQGHRLVSDSRKTAVELHCQQRVAANIEEVIAQPNARKL
jgi:hypothetical protein